MIETKIQREQNPERSTPEKQTLETEALREKLKKLWDRSPFINGWRDGAEEDIAEEMVELCFADGTKISLQNSGSVYDYILLARERYVSASTAEQVRAIVQRENRAPPEVSYYVRISDGTRKDELILPYSELREQLGWN